MPLRDHFRPPLESKRHWESMHATWPVTIVARLRPKLPKGFFAEPRVRLGIIAEIDVASFEDELAIQSAAENGDGGMGAAPTDAIGVHGVAGAGCL